MRKMLIQIVCGKCLFKFVTTSKSLTDTSSTLDDF